MSLIMRLGKWRWPHPKLRGSVQIHDITFPSLRGNPLGDPAYRPVVVYLPPDYGRGNKKYPVLVALAGAFGTSLSFLNVDPLSPNLIDRVDSLISQGLAPFILVIPDGFSRYGASQYINSSATGKYEDVISKDLIRWIDGNFRALPRRGIVGKSSGGFGALIQGMKHPDLFQAVACHSGDMYFEWCYKPDFREAVQAIQKEGGLKKFLASAWNKDKLSRSDFATLNIIAMAACYSPNPSAPLGFDLPFDPETATFREQVWKQWLSHDPVHLVEKYSGNLKKLKLLFIDCGSKDEYFLHVGARIFALKLRKLGVKHIHEEFSDGHMGIGYRYSVSVPKLVKALTKA